MRVYYEHDLIGSTLHAVEHGATKTLCGKRLSKNHRDTDAEWYASDARMRNMLKARFCLNCARLVAEAMAPEPDYLVEEVPNDLLTTDQRAMLRGLTNNLCSRKDDCNDDEEDYFDPCFGKPGAGGYGWWAVDNSKRSWWRRWWGWIRQI